jgi:hypothetical protein
VNVGESLRDQAALRPLSVPGSTVPRPKIPREAPEGVRAALKRAPCRKARNEVLRLPALHPLGLSGWDGQDGPGRRKARTTTHAWMTTEMVMNAKRVRGIAARRLPREVAPL